jgi:hypothetical protein
MLVGFASSRALAAEPMVLLSNGNIMRGTLQIQGDLAVLQRDDGSQMRLRRDQVVHSADSIEALYEYRVKRRSFRNPTAHVEDAKWCLRHGLITQAKAEWEGLRELDPSHPECERLRRQIEAAHTPRGRVEERELMLPNTAASSNEPSIDYPEGFSPAAIAAFATRVQPMLINRCSNAGCHRAGGETKWQLSHLGINVRVSAQMTQRNLSATLPYLNLDAPLSSDLLVHATTAHGAAVGNGAAVGHGGHRAGYVPSGHIAKSAEQTLRTWLSQLGRFPQPLVPSNAAVLAQAGFPSVPNPLPTPGNQTVSASRWPVVQTGTGNLPVPAPINSDDLPEGFAIDADGEWIYDPDGEFTGGGFPGGELNAEAGFPAPVQLPVQTSGAPKRLPKRLPTLDDPFSADVFNRQTQLTAPSSSLK